MRLDNVEKNGINIVSMYRVLHPGYSDNGGAVFVRLKFDAGKLSLCGVEGPMRNGYCRTAFRYGTRLINC